MFRHIICAALTAVLFTVAGCRSGNAEKNEGFPEFSDMTPEAVAQLKHRVEAFAGGMAQSFRTGNFAYWRAVLEKEGPPGKPLIVDENKFKLMFDRLEKHRGRLTKCTYLGDLDQSLMRDFLWKCTFEFRDNTGKLRRIEELFVVRCTVLKGKAVFTNFGFRFFNGPEYRRRVIEQKQAEGKKNEKTD